MPGELIGKYKQKGVFSSLMDKEPLTQIRKVELDRIAREYSDRTGRQKYG